VAETTPTPDRRYRGLNAEQRRAARRTRLLEAGLELLGKSGWQATTVTAVCEQAGLIPRYFYESFEDRDQLLVSIFDGVVGDAEDEIARVIAGKPREIATTLRGAATAWVKLIADDPRKGRVAFVEALGSEALMRRRFAGTRRYAEWLESTARAATSVPPERDRVLNIACLVAAGGIIETMRGWLDGSLESSAEELIEEYARVCAAGIDAAIAGPRKPRAKSAG